MQSKKVNSYDSKFSISIDKTKRSQSIGFQCFTPILIKNKEPVQQSDKNMRLSDRIYSIHEQFVNNKNQSNDQPIKSYEQNINYSRNITWKQLNHNNIKQKNLLLRQKQSKINNSNQYCNNSNQYGNIDQFLIIKSNDQYLSHQYPQSLQQLKNLLSKVKNQNKLLKEQNFKLRLQKVKQSSGSDILKTINLKSEIQKIKTKILNLRQQKYILQEKKLQAKVQQRQIKSIDQEKQEESPKYHQTINRSKLTQYDTLEYPKNQYNIANIQFKTNFNLKSQSSQNTKLNQPYKSKLKTIQDSLNTSNSPNKKIFSNMQDSPNKRDPSNKQESPNKQKFFQNIKQSSTKQSIKRQQYYPKFINKKITTLYGSGEIQKK